MRQPLSLNSAGFFPREVAHNKMPMNPTLCWMSVTSLLLVSAGCSREEGEPTHKVSGTVTQKGSPVEGAIVTFTPSPNGVAASGVTDESGVYQLTTRSSGDGAVIGKYRVAIMKYQVQQKKVPEQAPAAYSENLAEMAKPSALPKNLLPPKFANPETSKLEADVIKGENKFDFKVD